MIGKIKRTETELWLKEVLANRNPLAIGDGVDGTYTAYYTRNTDSRDLFLGYVTFVLDAGELMVQCCGTSTGDLDWLAVEHPPLERLTKLYNGGFYLHCHRTDQLLTAYHSVRVPRLIGNSTFDLVALYAYQEQEKAAAADCGRPFGARDHEITRSTMPERTVLPYYLAPGRGVADPLMYSAKLKHHHTYLMPHSEGVYVLVTAAQPANQTLSRQSLINNVIVWDSTGLEVDPMTAVLTQTYLHSFTVDLLKNDESAKTSLFEKLAKLMVEN